MRFMSKLSPVRSGMCPCLSRRSRGQTASLATLMTARQKHQCGQEAISGRIEDLFEAIFNNSRGRDDGF